MSTPALRVLLVITQAELGGAQRYVLTLAKALRQRGDHVVVACGERGDLISALEAAGVSVRVVPWLVRPIQPFHDARAVAALVRMIREGDFHIVHTNSTKAGVVGRVAAWLAGSEVIIFTAHGFILNEPLSRGQTAVYWVLERLVATVSSRLIAVSDADRAAIVRYRIAPAANVTVVRNGIELDPVRPQDGEAPRITARRLLDLPATATVVGTLANLYPTKGLDILIRAVPRLVADRPDLRVVVVGEGTERPRLERLIAELGLERTVRLAGRYLDGRALLPAFDLFVLPSRKEGLPLALLEAMAEGVPVVVTDAGGMPEVVEHGVSGLVVPRSDPTALADAISQLLEAPDTALRYREAARVRVHDEFAQDRMVKETIQIYLDERWVAMHNRAHHRLGPRSRFHLPRSAA